MSARAAPCRGVASRAGSRGTWSCPVPRRVAPCWRVCLHRCLQRAPRRVLAREARLFSRGPLAFNQNRKFVAGALDDALQVPYELDIQGVVGRLERFKGLVTAADEDAEKRYLPLRCIWLDALGYRIAQRTKPLL